MRNYPNVTEQDLTILLKLAEQQKIQRAFKIKNRILRKTHDLKLAESLSPITRKLDVNNETTKQLGEIVKKSDVKYRNTQTPAIEKITGTQSIRDTLALMKGSKLFFKLERKDNGHVFWEKILIKTLGEKRISIISEEYDMEPNIQAYFTNTKRTTKHMDDEGKLTVFNIPQNAGFYDSIP